MENSSQHVVGVPLAPQKRRPWTRYVAIGDSLSEGLEDLLPGGGLRGWAVLADHLRQFSPEMSFTNLAVRGYRARDAIQRELPEAIALQPDLITVFIGGNDVLLTPRLDAARFADDSPAPHPVRRPLRHRPALHPARPRRGEPPAATAAARASPGVWRPSTRSSAERRTATTPCCSTPRPSPASSATPCGASTAFTPARPDTASSP